MLMSAEKPQSLSEEEVKKVAYLARLSINSADIPRYSHSLSRILDFVAQMNAADTTGIEPMAHPQDLVQRLREDSITEVDQHQTFQQIAPKVVADLYIVPTVIEQE